MFHVEEENSFDFEAFHQSLFEELQPSLMDEFSEKQALRWYIIDQVTLERCKADGETEFMQAYFRSSGCVDYNGETIAQHLAEAFEKVNKSFDEFLHKGSGWRLKKINFLELYIAEYKPLAGSSCIELPEDLQAKKAIINIRN